MCERFRRSQIQVNAGAGPSPLKNWGCEAHLGASTIGLGIFQLVIFMLLMCGKCLFNLQTLCTSTVTPLQSALAMARDRKKAKLNLVY